MGWFERWFGRSSTRGTPAACPPRDWSDERGWDAFHSATPAPERHSPIDLGVQYVASFREKGFRRIRFSGAGVSAGPRAFAELGFDVLATDFSAVAVARQQELSRAPFHAELGPFADATIDAATVLAVQKHDFRAVLDAPLFDVVLNRRAFQGLRESDRSATARCHLRALRPGGWAKSNRWYRAALAATGIDFVIILGRALARGPNPSKTDQARLDGLTKELAERVKAEAEETEARLAAPDARTAHVIYSTG